MVVTRRSCVHTYNSAIRCGESGLIDDSKVSALLLCAEQLVEASDDYYTCNESVAFSIWCTLVGSASHNRTIQCVIQAAVDQRFEIRDALGLLDHHLSLRRFRAGYIGNLTRTYYYRSATSTPQRPAHTEHAYNVRMEVTLQQNHGLIDLLYN
jgi:hypothetical protein